MRAYLVPVLTRSPLNALKSLFKSGFTEITGPRRALFVLPQWKIPYVLPSVTFIWQADEQLEGRAVGVNCLSLSTINLARQGQIHAQASASDSCSFTCLLSSTELFVLLHKR